MEGAGRWFDSRTWVYDFTRDLPVNLRFSAAVAWEQARHINLVAGQGGRRSPSSDRIGEGAQFVTMISFRGPFPEASSFHIEIPAGLTDEMGRLLANANKFPLQVKTAEFPPWPNFRLVSGS
jgi:alpha-2-macroglobulin